MKKELFLFLGILCSIGFYSCQKTIVKAQDQVASDEPANLNANESNRHSGGLIKGPLVSIQSGFGFTEGPAVDKFGNVFFTDQPNDKIYKWDASSGNITLFLSGTGRSNGMEFDKHGNLIACADMHGELWKIRPNGSHEVLVNNYHGKLLNGPNDVWINPETGGMYITDPIFPRDYWDSTDPRKQNWEPTHSEQAATGKGGHVYYLAKGSRHLVRVTAMPGWNADSWPNGIVGTPDGKKLYVNQWSYNGSGGIWVFDIKHDGTLSNMRTFVAGLDFCDGMSMDELGNVYVSTNQGVVVYNSKGTNILTIPTGGGATNNVFGGRDEKTLFITGGGTGDPGPIKVFSQKMKVSGVEKFDSEQGHGHGGWHGEHH
ncbi:MAG: SMP-30/gluconolactonase/LRE family protein [Chitinophagaceae bacterium]